jgi:hypothetical protein
MNRYCETASADTSALVGAHSLLGTAWIERASRLSRRLSRNYDEMSKQINELTQLLPVAFFSSLPTEISQSFGNPSLPTLPASFLPFVSFLFNFFPYLRGCHHLCAALSLLSIPMREEREGSDEKMLSAIQDRFKQIVEKGNRSLNKSENSNQTIDLHYNCGTALLRAGWHIYLLTRQLGSLRTSKSKQKLVAGTPKGKKEKRRGSRIKKKNTNDTPTSTMEFLNQYENVSELRIEEMYESEEEDEGRGGEVKIDIEKEREETKEQEIKPEKEKELSVGGVLQEDRPWAIRSIVVIAKHFLFLSVMRYVSGR